MLVGKSYNFLILVVWEKKDQVPLRSACQTRWLGRCRRNPPTSSWLSPSKGTEQVNDDDEGENEDEGDDDDEVEEEEEMDDDDGNVVMIIIIISIMVMW